MEDRKALFETYSVPQALAVPSMNNKKAEVLQLQNRSINLYATSIL